MNVPHMVAVLPGYVVNLDNVEVCFPEECSLVFWLLSGKAFSLNYETPELAKEAHANFVKLLDPLYEPPPAA